MYSQSYGHDFYKYDTVHVILSLNIVNNNDDDDADADDKNPLPYKERGLMIATHDFRLCSPG